MSNKYLYQIVASASVWSNLLTIHQCKRIYVAVSKRAKEILGQHIPVEIERVQILNNNARRYWLWRDPHWITSGSAGEPTKRDLQRWIR